MEIPGKYVDDCHSEIFALFLSSLGPPSRALEAYNMERDGIPLHYAVGVTRGKGATNIRAQVPSIRTKR